MRHLEKIRQHRCRLLCLNRIDEDIREACQLPDKIYGMRFLEQREVDGREVIRDVLDSFLRFPVDGAETGVRILKVGTRVALEGSHAVHVEGIVIDPLACTLLG